MPPKNNVSNGEAGETGGKFTWEGANDTKLLLLIQGRYCKPDEYEQLSSAFPGTTTGSIRNRISGLRVKQRDLYESLGWTMPEGGAGHGKDKGKSKGKRAATEEGSEPPTPAKKARTPKKGGKKDVGGGGVKKEESEEGSVGGSIEVKSELEDDVA